MYPSAPAPKLASPASAALIINPRAGAPRGPAGQLGLAALLRRQGFQVETAVTGGPGHASELAARLAEKHPVVFAAGGDGTVHEVASGLLSRPALLGVLPIGSGNDLAAGLGIHSCVQGAAAAGARHVRDLDVAWLGEQPFFNSAGLLLSGDISRRARKLWRRLGRWRYVLAATLSLTGAGPREARWQLDGQGQLAGRWLLAEIGNGPRTGGGFRLLPAADPGDGQLDFCLVRPLGLPTLMRLLPAAVAGRHLEGSGIQRHRARSATLEMEAPVAAHLDGEPFLLPAGRHELRLEPGRLSVLAPAGEPT
jgi:diacylglycerol kinase (ATP)